MIYYQTNKQMKNGEKNNLCFTVKWKVFHINCDANTPNIALFLSRYMIRQCRRAEDCTLSVTGLNWLRFVDKTVEKIPVAHCTHKKSIKKPCTNLVSAMIDHMLKLNF